MLNIALLSLPEGQHISVVLRKNYRNRHSIVFYQRRDYVFLATDENDRIIFIEIK